MTLGFEKGKGFFLGVKSNILHVDFVVNVFYEIAFKNK